MQYIIHFLLLSTMMPLNAIPRMLAFDTSSARGSVALLEGGELRAELRLHSLQTHSTQLLQSIQFLLNQLSWKLRDLNVVAVGVGPGSFTGIRIGIATALGISQSLSIPFAGVSGLDALAHQAAVANGRIAVVLDAHRSQVYCAEYVSRGGKIRQTQKSTLIEASDLERHFGDRHLYIIGDLSVCPLCESKKTSSGWPRRISIDLFMAAGIGRLAFSARRIWRSGAYIVFEPMYIRTPDAVRNKSRNR